MLYELGVFDAMIELLSLELGNTTSSASGRPRSRHLYVILNTMYHITEAMRLANSDTNETVTLEKNKHSEQAEAFLHDIGHASSESEDLLIVKLLDIVVERSDGEQIHIVFLKKLLLLIWKLILVSLGGMETLKEEKLRKRIEASLPIWDENAADILRSLVPTFSLYNEIVLDIKKLEERNCLKYITELREKKPLPIETQQPNSIPTLHFSWRPKVRQNDIDQFVKKVYEKFLGWTDDKLPLSLMPYLPVPIQDGVRVMQEKVYTSLAEKQVRLEEAEAESKDPYHSSATQEPSELPAVEVLYRAMLPRMPQYMNALRKIFTSATTVDSPKAEITRCKEIVVKAISAILLLLLKHFKLNHVYQSEHLSYCIMQTSFNTTIIGFFNRDMVNYVQTDDNDNQATPEDSILDEYNKNLSVDCSEDDRVCCSWRNMFSCVNLLRVLNKVMKWKECRIVWATQLKMEPIMKHMLEVGHSMTQLYVLKLLKMQTKYLGYAWRRKNSTITRLINTKVRHSINDNSTDDVRIDGAQLCKIFRLEKQLWTTVNRFNRRRYGQESPSVVEDKSYRPVDVCLNNVLRVQFNLPEEFRRNYKRWLIEQVYNESADVELIVRDMQLLLV